MQKFIQILKDNNFEEEQISELISLVTLVRVKKLELLCDFKKPLQSIYFVLNGGFVLKYWDEVLENERTVNFFLDSFTPFMIDINSYFAGQTTASGLVAIQNSKVLVISKKDVDSLSLKMECLKKLFVSQMMEALLVEHNFRIHLITKSKESFYAYLLSDYPQIVREVPSKYIAEFMGISPEWLSKLKRRTIIS